MNPFSTVLLALAMSTDAFAAAVGKGAALHRPRWSEALRTGLIFGVIEALTPLVGWALGQAAQSYVQQWDHWIAFALLGGLGLHMVVEGFGAPDAPDDEGAGKARHGFWTLALTGFGTSIDAMAVGVSLAFIDVPILPIAATIGVATFVMVTTGVMVGRLLGAVLGKRAEIAGGLVLIGVGVAILVEHLSGAA